MTLPWRGVGYSRRRDAIVGYQPTSDGETDYLLAGSDEVCSTELPLAEFEARLFGAAPAEDDAYTRAAVRYAEASVALNDAEMKLTRAVDRKQHDTDDLRSDVCSAGYAHDDAEDAFTALYREKHGG